MRRSWPERFLIGLNVLGIIASTGLAWLLHASYGQAASIDRVQLAGTLTINEESEPGQRVFNLLLVGYDSSAGLDPDDPIQTGRGEQQLGDVIIVVHVDEVAQTAALLSIPRDLWLPIEGLGFDQRINVAYGVGGPATLIDTIEANLDIPIHHYASIDFAGFQGLVEAVGSVEIYFEEPARDWNANPSSGPARSQTGFEMLETGCQPLDPPTALAYVRSRYYQIQLDDGRWVYSKPSSDLGRVIRQRAFLQALMSRAIELGARNPFVLADLVDTGLDNVTIDQELTPQLLLDVGRNFRSFEPSDLQTYSYPVVNATVGTNQVLFGLSAEAEPILELFRGVDAADPATVRVSVVRGGEAARERADGVFDALIDAGFELGEPSGAATGPGIVIRHGLDGLQAANVVQAALAAQGVGATTIEQVDGLDGRDVVVLVGEDASTVGGEDAPVTTTATDQAADESGADGPGVEEPGVEEPGADTTSTSAASTIASESPASSAAVPPDTTSSTAACG